MSEHLTVPEHLTLPGDRSSPKLVKGQESNKGARVTRLHSQFWNNGHLRKNRCKHHASGATASTEMGGLLLGWGQVGS